MNLSRIPRAVKCVIDYSDRIALLTELILDTMPVIQRVHKKPLRDIQKHAKAIRDDAKAIDGAIGIACWDCKHRLLDDWHANRDFCQYYPTREERMTLLGVKCRYYETKKN